MPGAFLVPGFIDTHDHVESSMVEVRNFASGILPHGTTTIACDNHEITNVFGLRAVELFLSGRPGNPSEGNDCHAGLRSSIPGFEDGGAVITAEDVAEAYRKGWATVQGEQMNFPGLLFGDPTVHDITAASLRAGVTLTGHYASNDLNQGFKRLCRQWADRRSRGHHRGRGAPPGRTGLLCPAALRDRLAGYAQSD